MNSHRLLVTTTVALAILASSPAHAQASFTRRSVQALSPTELEQYRTVVNAMRALPVSDPRSWLYQAGIHQFITPADVAALPDPPFSPADKAAMQPYALTPPQHSVQHATWAQCHQSDPDRVFLVWHRIYLLYFERIARTVSGQASFALPYWDYTKGTASSPEFRRLPEGFRTATYVPPSGGAPKPNPLFALRRPSINDGNPLSLQVVSLASLSESSFSAFSRSLENAPHNAVHGAIGQNNTLLMGATVWAAQDPIFWLHHSNIDRLWECWKRLGNEVPPLGEEVSYTFIDEDGNPVTHTLVEMEQMAAAVDYQYEDLSECPSAAESAPGAAERTTDMELTAFSLTPNEGIELGDAEKSVAANLTPQARRVMRSHDVRARVVDFRVRLDLEGVRAELPIGTLYEVRIRPAGSDAPGAPVGIISFFGRGEQVLRPRGHSIHAAAGFALSFDVTDALFAADSFPQGVPETVDIVFAPTTGIEGGPQARGRIASAATPRIGEIRLVITGRSLTHLD